MLQLLHFCSYGDTNPSTGNWYVYILASCSSNMFCCWPYGNEEVIVPSSPSPSFSSSSPSFLLFFLLLPLSILPLLLQHYLLLFPMYEGSCIAAGYNVCCSGGFCAGNPPNCLCDQDCGNRGDCCSDIGITCPNGACIWMYTHEHKCTVCICVCYLCA